MPTPNDPMGIRRPSIKTRAAEHRDYLAMHGFGVVSHYHSKQHTINCIKARIIDLIYVDGRGDDPKAVY